MNRPATPYDELRYPGKFYPQASPGRIGSVAALFGLRPPPLATSRILELGCGEGGHLVPIAAACPEASCLGIDASAAAIERARDFAERAGVHHCEFRAEDVRAFPEDAGSFDYIIVHGVYSWVPEAAQQAILSICARHLAPEGLAYISYNAYPGGHVRQILRDLTVFHTKDIADPAEKVREARKVCEFIVGSMPPNTLERQLFARVLGAYTDSDALIRYDLLAEENEPVYFLDFMEGARALGLQFVAESGFAARERVRLPEPVQRWLEAIPDRLVREQYLDFIGCSGFRQSILCRSNRPLEAHPSPGTLAQVYLRSSLVPAAQDHLTDESEVTFRDAFGRELTCSEPVPKLLYAELGAAFPAALPYPQLRERIEARLGPGASLDALTEDKLVGLLLQSDDTGALEMYAQPPDFPLEIGAQPRASAVARLQAERGEALTVRGASGLLAADATLRTLVGLLDGSRDAPRLLRDWQRALGVSEAPRADALERALRLLGEQGLLVA